MNERIRDLKEQALIWAIETLDPDALNDNEWGVAIDAKFADMIVQECIDWCNAHARDDGTAQRIAEDIKKDFGVEE
jgi:hypothetical protein